MQDTGHVTNATAIQGHLKNLPFDFRHAAMMTVFDKKRLIWTARMLTAVPLFPLSRDAMFHHFGMWAAGAAVSYPAKDGSTSCANSRICRLISSIRSSRNNRTSRNEHTRWCNPAASNASTIVATVGTEPLRS